MASSVESGDEPQPRGQGIVNTMRAWNGCHESAVSDVWGDMSCGWPWAGFVPSYPDRQELAEQ